MIISVISFTRAGAQKNLELVKLLQEQKHQAASYSWHKYTGRRLIPFKSLKQLLKDLWDKQEAFLFLSDTGRAVRAVAPFLNGRDKGPAVLVVDEKGRFVIPLLHGRLKGADGWAGQVAKLVGATPVITSEPDREERFSVDAFAGKNRLHIQDIYQIRTIAARMSAGEPVGIYSDYPVEGVLPAGLVRVGAVMNNGEPQKGRIPEAGIAITDDWEAPRFARECRLFPENLILGVTCERDTPAEKLDAYLKDTLAEHHLSRQRISSVFSTDGLAKEPGLVELTDRMGIPFFTYTAKQLALAKEAESSEAGPDGAAEKGQRADSAAQRCAMLGSGGFKKMIGSRSKDGITISVYESGVDLTF